MPNHISNIVKMKNIAHLQIFETNNGKKELDFNKIIPMPTELQIDSGTMETLGIEAVLAKIVKENIFLPDVLGHILVDEIRIKSFCDRNEKTYSELEEYGLRCISNLIRFGATTWYDWCIKNWGTKWNAYETIIIDDDTISFQTAWSNPAPILYRLAKQYPKEVIKHWWADEDTGYNTGYRLMVANSCEEHLYEDAGQEALENYLRCWREDECSSDSLYRGKDGLLHYYDEDFE